MSITPTDAERLYGKAWQALNTICADFNAPQDVVDSAKVCRDKLNAEYREFWKKANEDRTKDYLAIAKLIDATTKEMQAPDPVAGLTQLKGCLDEAAGLLKALGLWKKKD